MTATIRIPPYTQGVTTTDSTRPTPGRSGSRWAQFLGPDTDPRPVPPRRLTLDLVGILAGALLVLDCGFGYQDNLDDDMTMPTLTPTTSPPPPSTSPALETPTPGSGDDDTAASTPPAETDHDQDGWTDCAWTTEDTPCDCDDQDPAVHPGALETCNSRDDDCDGRTDNRIFLGEDEEDLFSTVQAAVDAAQDGDTIHLACPGVYKGNVGVSGKSLTVQGGARWDETVLEGDGTGSTVQVQDAASLTLEALTITGGASVAGGGISVVSSSLFLHRVIVEDNEADLGGGIDAGDAVVHLDTVRLTGNQALFGGGVHAAASSLEVTNTLLQGNDGAEGYGGGMQLTQGSTATLQNVRLAHNSANWGGAIHLDDSTLTLENVLVDHNTASAGGGLHATGSTLVARNSVLAYNVSLSAGGGGYFSDLFADLESVVAAYNDAVQAGANLHVDASTVSTAHDCFFGTDGPGLSGMTASDTDLTSAPGFLSESDYHLADTSPLVNAGPDTQDRTDPDGSRNDVGVFGGPLADHWDLDADGWPAYFWPGTYEQAPEGVTVGTFDCDDQDPERTPGSGCALPSTRAMIEE